MTSFWRNDYVFITSCVRWDYEISQPHDDVIKWKYFPRYWPFVLGIHRSRWIPHTKTREALMFSLIYTWINGWVNNREAGDLRRHSAHYDVIVMLSAYLHPRVVVSQAHTLLWSSDYFLPLPVLPYRDGNWRHRSPVMFPVVTRRYIPHQPRDRVLHNSRRWNL